MMRVGTARTGTRLATWRYRSLMVLVAALMFWTVMPAANAQVLIVSSDGSAGYDVVAQELRAGLKTVRDGSVRIDSTDAKRLAGMDGPEFGRYELVVTVGLSAAQAALSRESSLPAPPLTLCLLIPRQSFERLVPPSTVGQQARVSALFIDQPLSRQLDLLRSALPDKHRLGVILGPVSQAMSDEIGEQAHAHAFNVKCAKVAEPAGVYAALQAVLPDSDLLLLLPDPITTSADTMYGLLLTSYRAQVPVAGYSEGLLNAGALVSLFSSASQQGREGAEIARRVLSGAGGLPTPRHPNYFTVRVNASVARSLGLHLPSEAALQSALENPVATPVKLAAPVGSDASASGDKP